MTTLVIHDSGTEENPIVVDGSDYDSAWITGDYVHLSNMVVPDGTGQGKGSGLSLEGSHCVIDNLVIGERWRAVDIRKGASHNRLTNISISRAWDGIYISGPDCEYNWIENCTAYRIGENDPDKKDGHSFAITNCPNNTFVNCISIENMRDTADIIAFGSHNTVFSRCASFGSRTTKYHLSATIRSDGSVFDRCETDGIIDIGGTPNVRVLGCVGEVVPRVAGPNSDTDGLIVVP